MLTYRTRTPRLTYECADSKWEKQTAPPVLRYTFRMYGPWEREEAEFSASCLTSHVRARHEGIAESAVCVSESQGRGLRHVVVVRMVGMGWQQETPNGRRCKISLQASESVTG